MIDVVSAPPAASPTSSLVDILHELDEHSDEMDELTAAWIVKRLREEGFKITLVRRRSWLRKH